MAVPYKLFISQYIILTSSECKAFLSLLLYHFEIYEIPLLIPFSKNKCTSISLILSNLIPVIFNIASHESPGEL